MKKLFMVISCLVVHRLVAAQNVAINNSASQPDGSAMLDVSSTAKGLLLPRMSTAQINLISNPAKGLLVYDSVKNQLTVNTGTPASPNWQNATGCWSLTGNSGTALAGQFLGTTDSDPLRFRQKNANAGIVDSTSATASLGFKALDAFTTGLSLSAFGYKALTTNTTGGNNVAVGTSAMRFNTVGNDNAALGALALYHNTSGIENNAYGTQSLFSNTTGTDNTSMGTYSTYFNTTGSFNVAMGANALQGNVTGSANTAIGYNTMFSNVSGSSNVALGPDALSVGSNRSYLVAIGDSALFYNGLSVNFPADGTANTAVGSKALYSNVAGYNNTALGYHSLFSNYGGNNITAIGTNADVSGTLNNATAVGANALATQSNSVQLGDVNVLAVKTAGDVFVKNGKGLIRSGDATQQKKLTTTTAIVASILAGTTISGPIVFSESFSTVPDVYVGNIVSGTGFAELTMTISNVTTTGATLNIFNPKSSTVSANFVVKVIGIGGE